MQLLSNPSHVMLICGLFASTACFSGQLYSQDMDMETDPAIITSLMSRKATEAEETTDRELSARVVELLRNRQWEEGVAAAEEAWTTWRQLYGGRPLPVLTASGNLLPPVDPTAIYMRSPSAAALEGAEQILEIVGESVDVDLAAALLRVRVPGLDGLAYSEAVRIGMELCRTEPKVQGILILARARERGSLLHQQQRDLNQERWWTAPRLTQRQPKYYPTDGVTYDDIYTALSRMDAEILAEAYRILSVRDTLPRMLSDLLNASLRLPDRQRSLSMAVVSEAIKDPRVEMRLMATGLLSPRNALDWNDPDRVKQLLRSRLEDYDGEVRYAAGAALLRLGDDAGLIAVVGRSADKLGDLRLESIGNIGAISATPWLIEIGRTPEQRLEVVRTLWALGDPTAVEYLGEVLLDEQEAASTRQLAVAALGATMDDRAFPYMSKALEKADEELTDRIIAAMTEIRPDLSFPVLVQSMAKMGILDGGPTEGRDLGIAWLRLSDCSGYRDVVGQFLRDPEVLKAGMQEYWDGRRSIHEAARQVQYFRFLHPDPEREAEARMHLAEILQRVPARSLQSGRDPTLPPERE